MRLAVFTNQFPGPVSTFFSRDMRGLLEAGIEVDVFPIYPVDSKLWKYVPDILSDAVLPRTQVHHLNFFQSVRLARPWSFRNCRTFLRDIASVSYSALKFGAESLAKSIYVFPKAWSWAQQNTRNYDHILAYWGNYSATCAYLFHRLKNQPIPFSMFLHAGIDLYTNQVFLKEKLLYADNIIVVCEFNRQFIHNLYPDLVPSISKKIHVHHLGLDFKEFAFKPNGLVKNKIIGVGRLESKKGFDFLLHAAHKLKSWGVDFQVELVGDGTQSSALKALAQRLNIAERVTFRGWLNFNEVRKAMMEATILVHPSSRVDDAVPTVIKEAMAIGKPVIASNVAGIPELLDNGRCGILVSPKDTMGLAKSIEKLLANRELQVQYATAAYDYAKTKFDVWQNGQQLANLLCSTTRMKPTT